MNVFEEPAIRMSREGLHVASESVAAKLDKKKLSPSLVTGISECPARWLANTFVLRDLGLEETDNAAIRGTLFHKVMEDFFVLPPAERTRKALGETARSVLALEEFAELAKIPDARQWLGTALKNYYTMGAKPEKIEIAKIPDDEGKPRDGLEVFVSGNIGDTKRDILGFVDRIIVDPKNPDNVIVEDWKSGAKAKRWNPKNKDTAGLGEARQQMIYAILLKKKGINVSRARLLYPVAQEIVVVNTNSKFFEKKVVADVIEADKKLDVMTDLNTFEYSPSFLCAWCPLVKVCPAANVRMAGKLKTAYESQPDPQDLKQAFEFSS